MPKLVHDNVLDAALAYIQTNGRRMGIVSTTIPSTVSSASTLVFASATMSTADYSLGNGTTSGRQIMMAAKATLAVTTTGTAGHVILFSTGATGQILYGTSCTTQVLGSTANSVTISSWKIEIADPV
jgi:hypothetical protein